MLYSCTHNGNSRRQLVNSDAEFSSAYGNNLITKQQHGFYGAMHYRQCKARSCDRMSSVRLTVTFVDCDHIGWNS